MRHNREKQLLSFAEKCGKKCSCGLHDCVVNARSVLANLMDQFGMSQDDALQAMLVGVEAWQGGAIDTLTPVIQELAGAATALS